MAKRIALFSVSTAASKYKRSIRPLLSINANFYIRLFIVVYDSAEDCKSNCLKHGYVDIPYPRFLNVEIARTELSVLWPTKQQRRNRRKLSSIT